MDRFQAIIAASPAATALQVTQAQQIIAMAAEYEVAEDKAFQADDTITEAKAQGSLDALDFALGVVLGLPTPEAAALRMAATDLPA